MGYTLSTTIKVSRETKNLLTRVLTKLEAELGRRLTYDDVIRILIEKSGFRNPEFLLKLKGMGVPLSVVKEAHRILEEEVKLEEEAYERRYGVRYKRSN